jgi:hypothetical protein
VPLHRLRAALLDCGVAPLVKVGKRGEASSPRLPYLHKEPFRYEGKNVLPTDGEADLSRPIAEYLNEDPQLAREFFHAYQKQKPLAQVLPEEEPN